MINATVWDMTSNVGTLTNEHGFYSLTLSEGRHKIRFSHIGSGEHLEDVTLGGNKSKNITLKSDYQLNEVVVTADLNSPLHTTQTGKVSLTAKDFVNGNNFMSSPDVVKKLQACREWPVGRSLSLDCTYMVETMMRICFFWMVLPCIR